MAHEELTAHQIEQDRLDALEEARLLPIRKAQFEALQGFAQWLNEMHPSEAPFRAVDPKNESLGPWIECPDDQYFEVVGETTEPDEAWSSPLWTVLWNLYQKRQ